jgi:hypothetical protein
LNVSAAAASDAGAYHVVVTNSLGSVQSASAEVTISATPLARLTIAATEAGVTLVGQGEPGATYDVQRSQNLTGENWTTIQTVVADQTGHFQIVAPSSGQYWFIRTSKQ